MCCYFPERVGKKTQANSSGKKRIVSFVEAASYGKVSAVAPCFEMGVDNDEKYKAKIGRKRF